MASAFGVPKRPVKLKNATVYSTVEQQMKYNASLRLLTQNRAEYLVKTGFKANREMFWTSSNDLSDSKRR